MPFRLPAVRIERRSVAASLDSATAVVLLVGPHGAGKSHALAGWAEGRDDVSWVVDGRIPERESGYLLVDDAHLLDTETWQRLDRTLRQHRSLRLRAASLTADVLPSHWDVEIRRDLYLTPEETTELVERLGSSADPGVIGSITHGHVGTTRFIARSRAMTRRAMLDVLTRAPVPEGVGTVPDVLAVPQYMTSALVAQLREDAEFLRRVEEAGLGGWSGVSGAPVFQLHPAVRARVRSRNVLDKATRLEIRVLAAEALLDAGALVECIAESVAAHRLDIAERAVMEGPLTLVTTHPREVELLLRGVPASRLAGYPVLVVALAVSVYDRSGGGPRALELARVATAGIASLTARAIHLRGTGARALLKGVEAVVMRVTVTGDEGIEAARKAVEIFDELPLDEQESVKGIRTIGLTNMALTLLYGGHLDEARTLAARGLDVPERSAESLLATGVLALVDVIAGRMDTARQTLAAASDDRWPREMLASHAAELLRIAQAWEAVDRSDAGAASAHLEALAPRVDTSEHWHLIAHVRALYDIEFENATIGLHRFRALRALRSNKRSDRRRSARILDVTEAFLHLALGDLSRAGSVIGRVSDDPDLMLAAARVEIARGRDRDALALVADASDMYPVVEMSAYVLRAVLLARAGRGVAAQRLVNRALAVGAVNGLRGPLKLLGADDQAVFGEGVAGVPALLAPVQEAPELTPRELIVAKELQGKRSLAEIAQSLHVSTNTVKTQVRSLYRKLGASSREEAIVLALALGILED